ncbi:MAG: ABC transporter permease [Solirubrobacteraceae bacterium]
MSRRGYIGVALIAAIVAFCLLGPLIHPTDQIHGNIAITNLPPGAAHPLGTDANGFDILGRLMAGGRFSLEIAAAVAVLATSLGAFAGALAGLTGGFLDALIMRTVDTVLALPAIFILIYLATIVTPTVPLLIVVISLLSWLAPARLVRAETLTLRSRDFVLAAQAMGAGRRHTIVRHILPGTAGTLIVNATFQVADAIILLATLSFLGFGLPPPAATWGGMLSQGTTYLLDGYWWEVYPVGALIVATVIAFNLLGEALAETLNRGPDARWSPMARIRRLALRTPWR